MSWLYVQKTLWYRVCLERVCFTRNLMDHENFAIDFSLNKLNEVVGEQEKIVQSHSDRIHELDSLFNKTTNELESKTTELERLRQAYVAAEEEVKSLSRFRDGLHVERDMLCHLYSDKVPIFRILKQVSANVIDKIAESSASITTTPPAPLPSRLSTPPAPLPPVLIPPGSRVRTTSCLVAEEHDLDHHSSSSTKVEPITLKRPRQHEGSGEEEADGDANNSPPSSKKRQKSRTVKQRIKAMKEQGVCVPMVFKAMSLYYETLESDPVLMLSIVKPSSKTVTEDVKTRPMKFLQDHAELVEKKVFGILKTCTYTRPEFEKYVFNLLKATNDNFQSCIRAWLLYVTQPKVWKTLEFEQMFGFKPVYK